MNSALKIVDSILSFRLENLRKLTQNFPGLQFSFFVIATKKP